MMQIESEGPARWNKLSLAVMGAGVVSLLAAGVLFVLSIPCAVAGGYSGPATSLVIGDLSDILHPKPTPTAHRPPPSPAPAVRAGRRPESGEARRKTPRTARR